LAYQGSGAVNKKISATSLQGIQYNPAGGALDMTSAAYPLWFAKVIVSDSFDLNTTYGVRLGFGSANNAFYSYNVAGTGANRLPVYNVYPPQGGYLITAINPNVSAWREGDGSGSPTLTAVDWFGAQCAMVNGLAKNENLALDAIDVGRGLYLIGSSPDATFTNFVTTDQDNSTNRWGCAISQAGLVILRGQMHIGANSGGASATTFTDNDSIVVFPDGYHAAGNFGVLANLGNASTVITIGCQILSRGQTTTEDTRADFTVTGTSGTAAIAATIKNHRNVTFNSATAVNGADIECSLLTQGTAEIENSVIRTDAVTQVACLQDPTFGTTTGLHNTEFIQSGAGHAIELDTATTYTFTNLGFTGYGGTPGTNSTPASGANDAAVLNSSGGAVTINITGGDLPSVRNTSGSTTTVVATVGYTITNIQPNTEVTILDNDVVALAIAGTATAQAFGQATGDEGIGQSFQLASTARVERIRLNIRKVGNPVDGVVVSLVNGAPGASVLAESVPYPATELTTSFAEVDIYLTATPQLTASTTYGVEFERTGALSDTNYFEIEYSTSDVHAGGSRYTGP
jgi:hypothetical protein